MLRPLFVTASVGLVGMFVASFVFSLLLPLAILAFKIAMFCFVGYFILRMVKPEMADRLCGRAKGDTS